MPGVWNNLKLSIGQSNLTDIAEFEAAYLRLLHYIVSLFSRKRCVTFSLPRNNPFNPFLPTQHPTSHIIRIPYTSPIPSIPLYPTKSEASSSYRRNDTHKNRITGD
jgi:hypothetical protein